MRDFLGWGFLLWFFGYILGIVLFMMVPPDLIGWIITPFGILITLWVLCKKIKKHSFSYFVRLGLVWAVIAIVCDYLFLVRVFQPADGYYKLDVYLYYVLTFTLPLLAGWKKNISVQV